MKILYLGLAILLLGTMLVAGCGNPASTTTPANTTATATSVPSATATSGPQYGGTLKILDDRPPSGTLGWFAEPGAPAGLWFYPMFEGMVRAYYAGEVKPLLAKDWEIAADLSSITLHLQQNVKFHDGSEFNAEVAKWNCDQFIAAKMSGVKDFDSVEVIDTYTIKINLKQYYNTFLYNLNSIPMVSKAAFDAHDAEWLRWNPVGTGPFKFESFKTDTSMTFTRNDDYWQDGLPYLDAIEINFIADPMTAAASFEAGEADAVDGNSPQILNDLKQKGFTLVTGFTGAITLIPDSKNPDSPLADIKVRQAIDYAINRDALVKAKGYGMWATTYQFAAPDSSAYIANLQNKREYNVAKAKQLLEEAGYESGLTITLIGDSSSTDKESTVAIQGYLSEVGIKAELNWVDYAGFVQYVMMGWNNGLLACANGFAPNLNSAVDFVWGQQAMFFPSVLKTDEMQALINAAKATRDYSPALAQKYLQKMVDDAMFLPLYCIIRGMATTDKVHDTGYLEGYGPYTWDPSRAWKSK